MGFNEKQAFCGFGGGTHKWMSGDTSLSPPCTHLLIQCRFKPAFLCDMKDPTDTEDWQHPPEDILWLCWHVLQLTQAWQSHFWLVSHVSTSTSHQVLSKPERRVPCRSFQARKLWSASPLASPEITPFWCHVPIHGFHQERTPQSMSERL